MEEGKKKKKNHHVSDLAQTERGGSVFWLLGQQPTKPGCGMKQSNSGRPRALQAPGSQTRGRGWLLAGELHLATPRPAAWSKAS